MLYNFVKLFLEHLYAVNIIYMGQERLEKNINVFFHFKKGGKVLIWNSNASENSGSLITTLFFWLRFFFWGGGVRWCLPCKH